MAELSGYDGDSYLINYLYKADESGRIKATGNALKDRERLIRAGYGSVLKDDRSKKLPS